MRDIRFVAQQRGGLLTKAQHVHLMLWGCLCAEHVLTMETGIDARLIESLSIAKS